MDKKDLEYELECCKSSKKLAWICCIALIILFMFYLNQTKESRESLEQSFKDVYAMRGNASMGSYNIRTEIIEINTTHLHPQETLLTMGHEWCHIIWYKFLDNEQREKYNETKQLTLFQISEGSKKSLHEDFSEHCAFWLWGYELDEGREIFMEDNVKRYLIRGGN